MAPPNTSPRVVSWWNDVEDEDALSRGIFDTVAYLEKEQASRRERNLQCLRLYGNKDYVGAGPFQYNRTNTESLPENRVKINIIASMVDTVSAKISKMRPKVTFLTSGGDFSTREKARKMQKFILGVFYANKIFDKHQQMFRDSLVFDIGALKHYVDGKKIVTERVLPTELYVDTVDAMYGEPTHLYHVKWVSKDVLAEEYPESEAAIRESAAHFDPSTAVSAEEQRDFCIVIEAWHIGPGKTGRHVIATDKAVLYSKPYKKKYFPFTFDRWTGAMIGFYGQSLAERLMGNQIEINKMLRVIQRSFHLGSAFKVFLEYGSKIAKEHISNDIGSLVYYSGAKPEFYVPQTVHPEYFNHLEWLIKNSYEEAGVSQLSATSKMPQGIDGGSGKALREYNDLESERFILQSQEYEQTFLETARIYIDLARDIGDYEVIAESKRFIETINWNEIDLEDNEFIMQMFPTSMLPQTPTGRLAYMRELLQDGLVDKDFALSLLEFPDIEGYTQLKTAPLDDILNTLDQILYKGKFNAPEPFQNLQLGLEIFQSAYLQAKKDGAPENRLEDLRRWMTMADAMQTAAKPLPAQQPMIPAGEQLRATGAGLHMMQQGGQLPLDGNAQAMQQQTQAMSPMQTPGAPPQGVPPPGAAPVPAA